MFAINRRALVVGGLAVGLVVASALVTAATASAQEKKRNLLIIGESKGYQHESITDAMATLYKIGRDSGKWDTCFRTDCRNITKKKLRWEAKNLDNFDAKVHSFTRDIREVRNESSTWTPYNQGLQRRLFKGGVAVAESKFAPTLESLE